MKTFRCLAVFSSFSLVLSFSKADSPGPTITLPTAIADSEWQALVAAVNSKPKLTNDMAPKDQVRAIDAYGAGISDAAHAFLAAHPTDPRRFEAMKDILYAPHYFMTDVVADPATPGRVKIIRDEAAAAAEDKEEAAVENQLLTEADVPSAIRESVEARKVENEVRYFDDSDDKDKPGALATLQSHVDAFVAKYPKSMGVEQIVHDYMDLLERKDPAAVDRAWRAYALSSNAAVKELAAGKVRIIEAKEKPFSLTFTSLDGRAVDVSKLQGKVVLIDFWATWCGPCKAEIPNVVATYKKYHDQGFEVVGISLDSQGARSKLADFVKTHDMPWPQYFDGKGWGNEVAATYSIQAIPAMFLLDKEGKIVSTNARGPKLEEEVRRYLAL